jgi:hypothetical protein
MIWSADLNTGRLDRFRYIVFDILYCEAVRPAIGMDSQGQQARAIRIWAELVNLRGIRTPLLG